MERSALGLWLLVWGCALVGREVSGASLKIGLTKTRKPDVEPTNGGGKGNGLVLNDVFNQRVTNRNNILYHGNITLGTPPQEFNVIFDTGSDITWVPGVGCQVSNFNGDLETESHCHRKVGLYDPHKSRTASFSGDRFQIGYQTGSANGFIYKDMLRFGALSGEQRELRTPVAFGVAMQTSYLDEGIFGLAFPHPFLKADSIFLKAMDEGFWDEPVFTAYYRDCPHVFCADGGRITLGDYDQENCEPVKHWLPIIPSVHENGRDYHYWWMFMLDGMSVDGREFQGPIKAFTDTGNSMIRLPPAVYARFVEIVRPYRFYGVHKWGGADHLLVPCTSRFNLTLRASGAELVIPAELMFFRDRQPEDRLCRLSVVRYPKDEVILGDAFLRAYCHVHDMRARRLGLAPPKQMHADTRFG